MTEMSIKRTCLTSFGSSVSKHHLKDVNHDHIQLCGGVFHGELLRLELPGLCIDYGVYNLGLSARKSVVGSCYIIGVLLACEAEVTHFNKEMVVGDIVYIPPNSELDVIVGGQAVWSTLIFNREQFESYNKQFKGNKSIRLLDQFALIKKNSATMKLLRFVREVLFSDKQEKLDTDQRHINKSLTQSLLEISFNAIFDDQQLSNVKKTDRHVLIVEAAEEYLNGVGMDPVKVTELAKVAKVSVRMLQYAFRDILGIAPVRYLKIRRLNYVRQKMLQEPEKTITHHASQAGFWHMAQFTKDYRVMFGETPSETMSTING